MPPLLGSVWRRSSNLPRYVNIHSLQPRTSLVEKLASPTMELFRRQQTQPATTLQQTYSDQATSPAPGTVVGIVFGSVAGFLFILWLIYLCFNGIGRGSIIAEEDIVVREHRGSRASRASRRTETIEVSRSRSRSRSPLPRRSPVRTETRTERIIVEERRAARADRDDDIIEVIEDHSPPRRKRSSRQPVSGYRSVDPDRYAGGNAPVEEVYSSRRDSRRSRR
ncbi:MAG: hypothetical protein M1825_001577 [Sarcosagium campestre]|nr:MAG: hypothetical protein M1825_001577 [Sarcosagium campestre]